MNILEEAIIYATVLHAGKQRKTTNTPYILHPLEVSEIISTMTDDLEVIAAGVLHDTVEDAGGTIEEIRARFGDRVAYLVETETERKYVGQNPSETWQRRKEESLLKLSGTKDKGVEMLWLGDKLSNIRSIAHGVGAHGSSFWNNFNQKDPEMHRWYYMKIAENIEMDLNRTGAFMEFIEHINFLWPGTFDSSKAHYKKYRELSIDNLKVIGRGAKSKVYRYNDELILKVYNENNIFKDIERENFIARKAFAADIPTAIPFGIVTVGASYGSLFELLESKTVSELIAGNPGNVKTYAEAMADLAIKIHGTSAENMGISSYMDEVYAWINEGIAYCDEKITAQIKSMVDALPRVNTMIHGDFHTGNVMVQNGEYLLIDMDRLSGCHPIAELCGIYMFYVGFGEINPKMIEDFMGFSAETALDFYHFFMARYLGTEDKARLSEVSDKAALLCYVRLVRRCYKKGTNLSPENEKARDYYMSKIKELITRVDSFDFER